MRFGASVTVPRAPVTRAQPPDPDRSHGRRARAVNWPLTLVGLSTAFGLFALRGETRFAQNLNDSAFHLQMVRWANGQIHDGRIPLDGWYPWLSLGSSFFHHYQSLAETLTAYAAVVTGAADHTAYLWLLYLLLATWPLSVYLGARLLGWDRWIAASAAAVAGLLVTLPGYGFEWGSYVWEGLGLYSQLWAMWLLPLAWGLTWRAVTGGRRYAAASLAVALTIACHFIAGYLALLTFGVWVIVLGGAGGLGGVVRRVGRAAVAAGGALLIALWVLVPLIGDTTWSNNSEYFRGTVYDDSYGARKVLDWLVRGQLFDNGRVPIVTLLVYIGFIVCLARAWHDVRARALLGVFTLSLLLFFGRPTLGPVLNLLPGSADIEFQRFVMGVDLAAILLAGVGLGAVLRAVQHLVTHGLHGRFAAVAGLVAVLVAVGALEPAWGERLAYARHSARLIQEQQAADAAQGPALDRLVAVVKRGSGRVYAGLRSNWGEQYRIGYVPVYAWLADRDVDAVGFTFRAINSLSTDVEAAFDETNPAQYQALGIRYLLLPASHQPPVPAKLIASAGGSRLYRMKTSGYFQVVDRSAAIAANRMDIQQATREWRTSDLAARSVYPGIAFAGGHAPPPTFAGASPPPGSPGKVLSQGERPQDGVFDATVRANRTSVVLLKASYDPRWTATVDGISTKPVMMAPSLVGVEVGPGTHDVRFRYRPYGEYPLLLAIGLLTLLALAGLPRARPLSCVVRAAKRK